MTRPDQLGEEYRTALVSHIVKIGVGIYPAPSGVVPAQNTSEVAKPSFVDRLKNKFNINQIATDASQAHAKAGVETLLNNPQVKSTLENINKTVADIGGIVAPIRQGVDFISKNKLPIGLATGAAFLGGPLLGGMLTNKFLGNNSNINISGNSGQFKGPQPETPVYTAPRALEKYDSRY